MVDDSVNERLVSSTKEAFANLRYRIAASPQLVTFENIYGPNTDGLCDE